MAGSLRCPSRRWRRLRRAGLLPLLLVALVTDLHADTDVLIVLNKSGHDASFVDVATGHTVATLPTGEGPHEVAVSPDGKRAVVANYGTIRDGGFVSGNTLSVYALTEPPKLTATLHLGEYLRPHGLQFLPDGKRLAVTAEAQRALIVVDIESEQVVSAVDTDQDASHMVVLSPDGKRAYVANIASNSMTAIDLEAGERLANVPTGAGCEGIDITPDGRHVWTSDRAAGTLSIVDTGSLEVVGTVDCPGFPIRLKFTADGKHALVSCATASELAVIDVEAREQVARLPVAFEVVDDAGERLFGATMADSPTPIGVLIHPNGRTAYVAAANADAVAVIDLATREVTGGFQVGREPDGLGFATLRSRKPGALLR